MGEPSGITQLHNEEASFTLFNGIVFGPRYVDGSVHSIKMIVHATLEY